MFRFRDCGGRVRRQGVGHGGSPPRTLVEGFNTPPTHPGPRPKHKGNRTPVPPRARSVPGVRGPSSAVSKLRPAQKSRPKSKPQQDRELDESEFPTTANSFRVRIDAREQTGSEDVNRWTVEQWQQHNQTSSSPSVAPGIEPL